MRSSYVRYVGSAYIEFFDTLDNEFKESEALQRFLKALAEEEGNSIVTTNWDVAIERALGDRPFHYDIPIYHRDGKLQGNDGLPLLKLHGSSNWAYCDCCRQLIAYRTARGKGAAHWGIFIDRADFEALGSRDASIPTIEGTSIEPQCHMCSARLSSRVATFSYAKTSKIAHFVAVWASALQRLRQTRHSIYLGYLISRRGLRAQALAKGS